MVGGETAHFRGVWGKQECIGRVGAVDSERGLSAVVDGIINNMVGV